jgi:hypothetical protein
MNKYKITIVDNGVQISCSYIAKSIYKAVGYGKSLPGRFLSAVIYL